MTRGGARRSTATATQRTPYRLLLPTRLSLPLPLPLALALALALAPPQGEIEYLDRAGIADESVDLVISNCVVRGRLVVLCVGRVPKCLVHGACCVSRRSNIVLCLGVV